MHTFVQGLQKYVGEAEWKISSNMHMPHWKTNYFPANRGLDSCLFFSVSDVS